MPHHASDAAGEPWPAHPSTMRGRRGRGRALRRRPWRESNDGPRAAPRRQRGLAGPSSPSTPMLSARRRHRLSVSGHSGREPCAEQARVGSVTPPAPTKTARKGALVAAAHAAAPVASGRRAAQRVVSGAARQRGSAAGGATRSTPPTCPHWRGEVPRPRRRRSTIGEMRGSTPRRGGTLPTMRIRQTRAIPAQFGLTPLLGWEAPTGAYAGSQHGLDLLGRMRMAVGGHPWPVGHAVVPSGPTASQPLGRPAPPRRVGLVGVIMMLTPPALGAPTRRSRHSSLHPGTPPAWRSDRAQRGSHH